MSETAIHPVVRELVDAINSGDRPRFLSALTPDATLSDDGTQQDLEEWIDREIFTVNGHLEIQEQDDDGLALTARYRNDTWGEMRTRWRFTIVDGKIGQIATGQA
ncbi:MAG: nuclear transport factor 2 family protein [Hamadaea sp.]|uniref:nuclear transport factor 2 family protein n=1 Tax=Hamadaea sp. TaxID=2024425 RepID=UPI0017BBBCC8|nr:nuclear transport factor 2 family protein [Hamadaea sp.]NUR72204.1 nuclear transport factor 2 family protein [Hamadaea sp.]NUT18621.1 nuclear transport factor 2 family protein [Hamadaea sp.]